MLQRHLKGLDRVQGLGFPVEGLPAKRPEGSSALASRLSRLTSNEFFTTPTNQAPVRSTLATVAATVAPGAFHAASHE